MKTKTITIVLLAVLLLWALAGCADAQLDAVEDKIENRLDGAEDAIEDAARPAPRQTAAPTQAAAALTREQAEAIALEYAGFTADQVTGLRTEYEIDDGRPQYDVRFYEGRTEYEFEIDAETGRVISFDKDT